MPVQETPGWQPGGRKPKLVPGLLIAGLAVQSGRFRPFTPIGVCASKKRSFCVPATAVEGAESETLSATVCPGRPATVLTIRVSAGGSVGVGIGVGCAVQLGIGVVAQLVADDTQAPLVPAALAAAQSALSTHEKP